MAGSSWVEIGYVARAQGLKGDVRVKLHNPSSEILFELEHIYLDGPGDLTRRALEVHSARAAGTYCVLSLAGVSNREHALSLVGAHVCVPREALPTPEEDEFYFMDLIGLKAVDERGASIGDLVDIYPTAAHDIYVVRRAEGAELLVPARTAHVRQVDLESGIIVLTDIENLIETNDAV